MRRGTIAAVVILLSASNASAADDASARLVELFAGYAYLAPTEHVAPEGWSASVALNVGLGVRMRADASGHYGAHPALYMGAVGVQVFFLERWVRTPSRLVERFSPYVHGLLGMAGWTYYDDEGLRSGAYSPVVLIGGGFDVRLWPWLALRAEIETSLPKPLGVWLWRFSCGLVFRFGGTEPYMAQR